MMYAAHGASKQRLQQCMLATAYAGVGSNSSSKCFCFSGGVCVVSCAEGGHVYPNDGAAYFKARFRLVVFRPFVGEVLVGTLTACTK